MRPIVSLVTDTQSRKRIFLQGNVQGIGLRPAVVRLSQSLSLTGMVQNCSSGVVIEVQGIERQILQFQATLLASLPTTAVIESVKETIEEVIDNENSFVVVSPSESDQGSMSTRVPVDLMICNECLLEISDPNNRRTGYAFTSCTNCGPRFSILQEMPYEREDTSMDSFPLCELCLSEYTSSTDRRFHAQTNACAHCGPTLWVEDHQGNKIATGSLAIKTACRFLAAGKILALKGVGGYQLLVDATNEAAINRLREKKQRYKKPFAVMVQSNIEAETYAKMEHLEQELLSSSANPIVPVLAVPQSSLASSAIHPDVNEIGLFLPSSPLHALLLLHFGKPVVCTSGNIDGEPLEYLSDSSEKMLSGSCDIRLEHNRTIENPIDDSVVRVIANRPTTLRLARGMAPHSLRLHSTTPILALGGHLKNSLAWCNGSQAVLGPHIGNLETVSSRNRFIESIERCKRLYRFEPEYFVHDLHPEYFTTEWAIQQTLPTIAVQHHHAHIVAGMLEHSWLERQVLGVAWDGTGYGSDGIIWGGEFLLAEATKYHQVARLRPFRLPGGEAAIREPWKIAISLLQQIDEFEQEIEPFLTELWGAEITNQFDLIEQVLEHPQLSPLTSSVGRLFDAVAALLLSLTHTDFEGQAGMYLESIANRSSSGWYSFPLVEQELLELDWQPLLNEIISDLRLGVSVESISMKFHRTLALGILLIWERFPNLPIVLTGGVFQNRLLTELVVELFSGDKSMLGLPGRIPVNDGGLAAGQLAVAIQTLAQQEAPN